MYEGKTLEELKEELDAVESSDFYLQMKDMWSQQDYKIHDIYYKKRKELQRLIAEKEGEKNG
jgi:hypothetical protein